ncbi:G2-specific protein kinase nim-1 [Echria macrotheca]|uniref:non-specific serine/threonine protein kinase n=1 Tax=Echria macrotheca TaxID=438768 RepID=A0AAJ0F830_9PEZI|nr:G2-specific protein kinase nim-1 [Echria macrotheca]
MAELDNYDVLEKIGHGSFGIIRKVRRRADGMILCRKEISYLKMSQKEREQLHAEFQILSTLRHPNIVGYYHREHLKATQDLHLYMEYCGNGDLGRLIRDLAQKNQYAEEAFVWSIFSQLVTALYRCHYGVDPPEVGKTVLGLGATAKPKAPTGGMTILHRDLKPENVFLGEDNSVKLGDFGLSKVMQSHDFASTYVGTPFYMSPEICAAEKYTLKSDIWALGCIIYELCSWEPPFNAKTHYQLVQKIKLGKIAPLPPIYSRELHGVILDCLQVNPDQRPDTATLLNLPAVRLMRKEKEVADYSKTLKAKEEALNRRIRELEQKVASIDHEKLAIRHEIDSQLRREWEVKARLEIDRLVALEIQQLQRKFEHEVHTRVEAELAQRRTVTFSEEEPQELGSSKSDGYPHSSISCGSGDEFPSTTDITELSVDAPDTPPPAAKKAVRTPFARAQTMFVTAPGSVQPMDIEAPSPITIASLSLSPRRNAGSKAPVATPSNIFGGNSVEGQNDEGAERAPEGMDFDSGSDDDLPMPSPTRSRWPVKNPFTSKARPVLQAQKSAPVPRLQSKQVLGQQSKTTTAVPTVKSSTDMQSIRTVVSNGALQERSGSPNRRLSKIPSSANLNAACNKSGGNDGAASGMPSLNRKASFTKKDSSEPTTQPPMLSKMVAASKSGGIRGRTLVELQQARAGGRPLSGVMGENINVSPTRPCSNRGSSTVEPAPVWDPERDEMPSPFLVRRKQPILRA